MYETERFYLASDFHPFESRRIVRALESYSAGIAATVFAGGSQVRWPKIRAVALQSRGDFQEYFGPLFSGLFVRDMPHEPLLIVGTSISGAFSLNIVKHEIAHYVMDAFLQRPIPQWYSEGMASHLETSVYDQEGALRSGGEVPHRSSALEKLGPLPVATLVAHGPSGDSQSVDRYYASAWAFVRFLIDRYPDALVRFHRHMLEGKAEYDAWETLSAAIGDDVDDALAAYVNANEYASVYETPWRAPDVNIVERPLSPARVAAVRALLYWVGATVRPQEKARLMQQGDRAIKEAQALAPHDVFASQIAIHGFAAKIDGMAFEEDVSHAAADSWSAWLSVAELRKDGEGCSAAERAALDRARAIAADEIPVVLAAADCDLREGRWPAARARIEQAYARAPRHVGLALALSRTLAGLGLCDEAQNALATAQALGAARTHGQQLEAVGSEPCKHDAHSRGHADRKRR